MKRLLGLLLVTEVAVKSRAVVVRVPTPASSCRSCVADALRGFARCPRW